MITFIHQPVIAGGLAAAVMVTLIMAGRPRPKPRLAPPAPASAEAGVLIGPG
jgi:hypothetical protein